MPADLEAKKELIVLKVINPDCHKDGELLLHSEGPLGFCTYYRETTLETMPRQGQDKRSDSQE